MNMKSSKGVAAVAIALTIVLVEIILIFSFFQARVMERELIQALMDGKVGRLPGELQGKEWTGDEFTTVRATDLSFSIGAKRVIPARIHTGWGLVRAGSYYSFQGTVRNKDTGVIHVFGRLRDEPGVWVWVMFHGDSAAELLKLWRGD